ncbi:rhodanese-like domain-containing protein [Flavihumibacter rivuli]|uniref:rhodanese-like domain-containing protein n=1 Tax=Flavihumibacter rivuli TaxID=2838156 RepID=UPI001BDF5EF7|nr:rhodanese-like domain-containing protein [Flavihumibacter rivuli]ULQ56563.1 rhodanese-like domain-containing protein [Flavihumibacter rivuli]
MQQITAEQLRQQLHENQDLLLVDVREEEEHEAFNIGGLLLPLGELMSSAGSIPKDKPVVVYCKRGIRSAIAIQRLQERFGYTNLLNLQGGMEEWKKTQGHP